MTCVQHWPRLRTSLISKWPVSCERTPRSGFWFLGPQGWCIMMSMTDSHGWYMYVCVIYVAMVNHGDYGWLWWFTTGIVMFFMKGQGCWCRTEADQRDEKWPNISSDHQLTCIPTLENGGEKGWKTSGKLGEHQAFFTIPMFASLPRNIPRPPGISRRRVDTRSSECVRTRGGSWAACDCWKDQETHKLEIVGDAGHLYGQGMVNSTCFFLLEGSARWSKVIWLAKWSFNATLSQASQPHKPFRAMDRDGAGWMNIWQTIFGFHPPWVCSVSPGYPAVLTLRNSATQRTTKFPKFQPSWRMIPQIVFSVIVFLDTARKSQLTGVIHDYPI